jgi:hypothetical protein
MKDIIEQKLEVTPFEYLEYSPTIRAIFKNTPLIQLASKLVEEDNRRNGSNSCNPNYRELLLQSN